MKKLSFLLLFTLLFAAYGSAQNVPRGMKYQAVARDLKGEILANTNIDLKINLVSKKDGNNVMHYSEVHSVTTNQVGLFTLVVGEGKVENGNYEKVPWSNADIWMEIQIKTKGEETFASISNSQLMAVPYAYYSATAGVLVGTKLQETPPKDTTAVQAFGRGEELPESPKCDCDGGLSQVKVLYLGPSAVTINVYKHISCGQQHLITSFTNVNNGAILTINANGNCPGNKLPDNTYLKVVSPGIDLVTLPTSCEDPIVGENFGNFSVLSRKDKNHGTECTVCDIRADWMIGGNGVFDMCNWMGTKTNTDLVLITNNIERLRIMANGDVDLKKNLHVGINLTVDSATNLNSRVGVAGITSLNNTTQSTTPANGALVVAGGTGIAKNLNVGGNLNVLGTTSVGGPVGFGGAVHITDLTQSTSTTTGALIVDGGAGIAKNVNVGGTLTAAGATTINNTLTLATDNANYAATFQNTNAADGDGIQIKLGKNHPLWNGTSYRQVDLNVLIAPFQPQIDVVRGWVLSGHNVTGSDIISLVESNAALLAGTLCQLTNFLTDQLNTRLGLPFNVAGPVNSALGLPLNLSTPINSALGLPLNIAAPINSGLGLPFDIATPLNNAMGLPYKILDETIIPKIPSFGIPAISSLTIPAIP